MHEYTRQCSKFILKSSIFSFSCNFFFASFWCSVLSNILNQLFICILSFVFLEVSEKKTSVETEQPFEDSEADDTIE